jgi:hypothetical protein
MKIDIKQLMFIHPKLRVIAIRLEKEFCAEFTSTSLFRIGDHGVHGQLPLRGLDLRCRYGFLGILVQDYVNTRWQYDPKRPDMQCCLFHDTGSGFHLHLQVHPNTKRK